MNYGLYKRIMKRDPKAIDEIETLEEAKEIIKMMTGNVYLNGEVYNQMSSYFAEQHLKNKPEIDVDLKNVSNVKIQELVQEIIDKNSIK